MSDLGRWLIVVGVILVAVAAVDPDPAGDPVRGAEATATPRAVATAHSPSMRR